MATFSKRISKSPLRSNNSTSSAYSGKKSQTCAQEDMKKVVYYSDAACNTSGATDWIWLYELCFIHTTQAYIAVKSNEWGFHELAHITLKIEYRVKKCKLKKDIYHIISALTVE